jgi:hypothetical protein
MSTDIFKTTTELDQEKQAEQEQPPGVKTRTFRIVGNVPPEMWNRLGTRILPKMKTGQDLQIRISFSVTMDANMAKAFESDIRQALDDLHLEDVHIE